MKLKDISHNYAVKNGELPGTMDYITTVHDFENGFKKGVAANNIGASVNVEETNNNTLESKLLAEQLKQAKALLQKTFELPQNQKWNSLYHEGEKIRNDIKKFLNQC